MLRQFILIIFIFLSLVVGVAESWSRPGFSEEQVKAVFLLNVTHFVTWPDDERNYDVQPFTFCVVGNTYFADELRTVLKGELVSRVQPVVVVGEDPLHIPPCDLVYVDKKLQSSLQEVLLQVNGLPILTVGDDPNFCRDGGGVTLELRSNRIKLHVNVDAVRSQHLQISSKLLQIATVLSDSTLRDTK